MGDRMFDRMRDKRAFALTDEDAIDGDLESLRAHDYAVLVTYRRSGEAMPSNARGRPDGPAVRAAGRVLRKEEWAHAEDVLASTYGAARAMSERVIGGPEESAAYIELTPGR